MLTPATGFDGYQYIDRIAEIDAPEGRTPDPKAGIGRSCIAFSASEDKAFAYTEREALLLFRLHDVPEDRYRVWKDAIGNLFITYYGEDRGTTVMCGSHLDSVPDGGKYDGVAGVASAMDCLAAILATGRKPASSYTVSVWRAEESPSTGRPCVGSDIATALITPEQLEAMTYQNGGPAGMLRDRFSADIWALIREEVARPPIREGALWMPGRDGIGPEERIEILAFLEDHIAQSAFLEKNKADMGIVTDIGGSVRELVKVPALRAVRTLPEAPRRTMTFTFTGEAAHTGGAPPNRTEDVFQNGRHWYRKDALIGAAEFFRMFRERWAAAGLPDEALLPVRCSTPLKNGKPVSHGYTTITPEQELVLSVPDAHAREAERIAEELSGELERRKRVATGIAVGEATENEVVSVDPEQFAAALAIPGMVERIVREAVAEQNGTGNACYTVTDFALMPGAGLHAKVDLRHTDIKTSGAMRDRLDAELSPLLQTLDAKAGAKTFVSESRHVALDAAIANIKEQIAQTLGIRVIRVPSMPGHDTRSLALAGIPAAMNFSVHDGKSHNPREFLSEASYRMVLAVTRAVLEKLIGLGATA